MSANAGPKRRSVPLPTSGMLPRLGKIRLGVQEKTTRQRNGQAVDVYFPKAVDYFVVVEDESGITSPQAAAAFHAVYPGEPRSLRCLLPGHTPADVFEGAWRLYGSSKLKRKCDGQTCDERLPGGGWSEQPCLCRSREIPEQVERKGALVHNPDHCALTYTLQVVLPDVPGVGVWQIDTGSVISSRNVADWLALMFDLTSDLAGLRFDLDLVPVKVAPDGRSKTVYVLRPRQLDHTPHEMLQGAGRARPMVVDAQTGEITGPQPLAALPAPAADDARDPLLAPKDGFADRPANGEPAADELLDVLRTQFAALADDKDAARNLFDTIGIRSQQKLITTYGEHVRDLAKIAEHTRRLQAEGWTRDDAHHWTHPEEDAAQQPVSFDEALNLSGIRQKRLAAQFEEDVQTGNIETPDGEQTSLGVAPATTSTGDDR